MQRTEDIQPTNALNVTNLKLKFPGEQALIFNNLSLAVPKGQKVLLLGPSGCGKSTLLQVLSGIIPDSVEVPLKYDTIQRPESWGFVFQDPDTQFCMAYVDEELAFVLENLRVPREQMEVLMVEILEKVGLHFENLHMPIHTLSQGMKQRLALASVLLLQPDTLFLDEPSAMLDPEGTEQIWASVKEVLENKTVLIVEHKMQHVSELVDRVVLFNRIGEIIADGQPSDIFVGYKAELIEYGIWYPTVWHDYVTSSTYKEIMNKRWAKDESNDKEQMNTTPFLTLNHFAGYRGEKEMIKVDQSTVLPGEWVTIVGPNGAGKSTLLLSLVQLLRTSGTYMLEGSAIQPVLKRNGKTKSTPPKQLAFVFQNPELQFLTNSIFEEVAYELRLEQHPNTEIEQNVRQMLTAFDMNMNEERHPYQLSVGQKRRLSIASAIVRDKRCLLLDEPTFGQDAKNTFAILEMLESIRMQGVTIIMVTHDMNIVEHFADTVWHIDNGSLHRIDDQSKRHQEVQHN